MLDTQPVRRLRESVGHPNVNHLRGNDGKIKSEQKSSILFEAATCVSDCKFARRAMHVAGVGRRAKEHSLCMSRPGCFSLAIRPSHRSRTEPDRRHARSVVHRRRTRMYQASFSREGGQRRRGKETLSQPKPHAAGYSPRKVAKHLQQAGRRKKKTSRTLSSSAGVQIEPVFDSEALSLTHPLPCSLRGRERAL